jgi:hypothetical protein
MRSVFSAAVSSISLTATPSLGRYLKIMKLASSLGMIIFTRTEISATQYSYFKTREATVAKKAENVMK